MRTAADLMTKNVISVTPETPLLEAVNILLKDRFNGIPVVDRDNNLLGIITEYDLILKGTAIHLPTFLTIFQEMEVYKKGSEFIREDLKKIFKLKVEDVMNKEPLFISQDTPIIKVADLFSQHHRVNPILVVDAENKLTGIISRYDLLKFLGDTTITDHSLGNIDENINQFLGNYKSKFTLVSKSRTKLWLVASILFAIVGFAVAWFLILRVSIK